MTGHDRHPATRAGSTPDLDREAGDDPTSGEAFVVLSQASQHSNRPLRDVAAHLVFEGSLDDLAPAHVSTERGRVG